MEIRAFAMKYSKREFEVDQSRVETSCKLFKASVTFS